jgi:cytochrome c oxidase subunit II
MPVFAPNSPQAQAITSLFTGVLVMSAVILLLVAGPLTYIIIKYRWRPERPEPPQVYGNTALEIAWTVGPLVTLAVVFVFTVVVMHRAAPPDAAASQPADMTVVGHQWWWEIRYPGGAVTANEPHIPTGKRLFVRVLSADVIHDFWVPSLGPKVDAVPGHPSDLWLEADTPGVYEGTCAEYCGAEHAWMRIHVYADQPAAFDAWLAHQETIPALPTGGEAERGLYVFRAQTCASCHRVAGTPANGTAGPDLTHLASRKTLGTGVLQNSPASLLEWVGNPQAVKPGVLMPNLGLAPPDLHAVVAYLETLK